jgi:hypothetical protein
VAFIKATKRRHRASTCSDITNRARQFRLIPTFHREKGLQLTCWSHLSATLSPKYIYC